MPRNVFWNAQIIHTGYSVGQQQIRLIKLFGLDDINWNKVNWKRAKQQEWEITREYKEEEIYYWSR